MAAEPPSSGRRAPIVTEAGVRNWITFAGSTDGRPTLVGCQLSDGAANWIVPTG